MPAQSRRFVRIHAAISAISPRVVIAAAAAGDDGAAEYPQEGQGEGEGDPRAHAVRRWRSDLEGGRGLMRRVGMRCGRGLDNAGKTTILKKFMGQDITEISPTLGFDIQTLEYKE
ncbi:unnamed protein product [Phytophthora fragariaefolia]|uniref:Unnamed protein product n=1 Tax=Phytophthora fragariaefolia TaxID=1490495 RepID=A0A9W6XN09_9STRA|nr:unnamed protein product [Phytophthora fragariaefolia]